LVTMMPKRSVPVLKWVILSPTTHLN